MDKYLTVYIKVFFKKDIYYIDIAFRKSLYLVPNSSVICSG